VIHFLASPLAAMVAALAAIAAIINSATSPLVAWAAVLSPIIAAGFGAYLTWRLRQVHLLVNNAATMQDRRIAQLADALTTAGVPIPGTTQQTGVST
jgi:pheromone shutdown protein TraB